MLKMVKHFWFPEKGERVVTPLGNLAFVVSSGSVCELVYVDGPSFGQTVELDVRLIRKAPTYGSALK
jgi:hypothetical protein